jgi:uncharacterized membrane protein YeaQ/YmgE (transglycosylase-associated protein family)
MDIVMWMLAGGVIGWVGFAYLGFDETQGMIGWVIIGMVGGLLGGRELAPMFGFAAAVPGDFSLNALFVALASAVACLAIANMIHNRYSI